MQLRRRCGPVCRRVVGDLHGSGSRRWRDGSGGRGPGAVAVGSEGKLIAGPIAPDHFTGHMQIAVDALAEEIKAEGRKGRRPR